MTRGLMTHGIMPLIVITPNRKRLSMVILSIITVCMMTLSISTLGNMILNVKSLSTMAFEKMPFDLMSPV